MPTQSHITKSTELPESLDLYGYWRSSASWRVRWALELKGALYNYKPVNLLKKEHLAASFVAMNPNASVPLLVINNNRCLGESMAIIEWIDETYALEEASLFWGDTFDRAKIRELCEIINADTAPLQNLRAQNRHSDDATKKLEWAQHWIRRGLDSFQQISAPVSGTWSFGDDVSAADLFLIPQIYNSLRFQINVEQEFPKLWAIFQQALITSECHRASPEQQVDAIK